MTITTENDNHYTESIETIIAPASAIGGGVAVLRASGPLAGKIFRVLVRRPLQAPRVAQLVTLLDPVTNKVLDSALALYFQNPGSFTGEDVLELHVHGGRAVVQNVLQAMLRVDPGIRLATGGEFTKRAYLNGKIDLTEAEAIADLVAAETEAQADQALAQMRGGLRDLYESWRTILLRQLAYLEAAIDFVDEEDVPPSLLVQVQSALAHLRGDIGKHLDDGNLGERLRDGFVVAIIGAPNAGKSSLINTLSKRDVAIVTPHAGTTRDVLEVPMNLGGYPVIFMDTAGLRETSDAIEAEGIRRARQRAGEADIIIALFDATQDLDQPTLAEITPLDNPAHLVVMTKTDLLPEAPMPKGRLSLSTKTGQGVDGLIQAVTDLISRRLDTADRSQPLLTQSRHREAITEVDQYLARAENNPVPELMAEDIRLATRALGRVTGRVDVEDLLDVIFRDFCIGK